MPAQANKKIIKENFNWILISLHFGGGLHLAKVATIYFWLQEPPRTENLQSNFHFWQIAHGPTNFLFSTGLTKSTRQSGKECTKGRADRIWQKAVSTFAAIPAPSFSPTISLLAAAVGSSGWSGLNIIYQIFGHLAGHLGPRQWFMGFSPIAPSALSSTMGNSIRPCVTHHEAASHQWEVKWGQEKIINNAIVGKLGKK